MGSRLISYKPIVFGLMWLLYALVFMGRKLGLYLPEILNSYLTDLLCIPLVLGSTQWIIQKLKKQPTLKITPLQTAAVVIYFVVVFEWWLPIQNSIYTSDIWDVVCYCIGGLVFIGVNNLNT